MTRRHLSSSHLTLTSLTLALGFASPHGAAYAQSPTCESVDPTTAEVNSRQGVEMARQGDYEGALALFRVASKLDACEAEYPMLQARALTRLKRRDEAVAMYTQVIERFPGTPAAARAAEQKKTLLAQAPEPDKKDPEPQPPKPVDWTTVGYIGAGAGALMVVGGVLFALDAQSADDEIPGAISAGDRARYDELVDQRDSSSSLSYLLYGLGGAAVAGGLAAVLLSDDDPARPAVTVVPDPHGGAHFGWTVRF